MKDKFPYCVVNVECDFLSDRNEVSAKILMNNFGIKSSSGIEPYYNLLNISKRIIPARKRVIHLSRTFNCPVTEKNGYDIFVNKVSRGDNINNHLSKKIFDDKVNDGMLLDFGLYHFHLGVGATTYDNFGNHFSARSGPLLIAAVRENDIYFLGVFNHGVWTNVSLVEIIHKDWPFLLERWKISRVSDVKFYPNEIDRNALRKNNINSFLKMPDGVIYHSTGGGFNAAGGSTDASWNVVLNTNFIFKATPSFIPSIIDLALGDFFSFANQKIKLKMKSIPNPDEMVFVDEFSAAVYIVKMNESKVTRITSSNLPKYAVLHKKSSLTYIAAFINEVVGANKSSDLSSLFQFPTFYKQ